MTVLFVFIPGLKHCTKNFSPKSYFPDFTLTNTCFKYRKLWLLTLIEMAASVLEPSVQSV